MINKYVELNNWIKESTIDSINIVELGAGFFDKLEHLHPNVQTKIGIEIYQPYIDNAIFNDCIKIQGDILNYKELLKEYIIDTVVIIDVLEHFEKDVALKLINDLKKDFDKILLMLPIGLYEQTEDITGYGGHTYQTHRSTWNIEDVEKLGFNENILDPTFHSYSYRIDKNLDTACYFGIWKK